MAAKKVNKNSRKRKSAVPNKAITKKLTPDQINTAKQHLTESLKSAFSPDEVMEKLWKEYLPVLETGDVKNLKHTDKSIGLYRQAISIFGLDNHVPLSETVKHSYRPLVMEISRQIIRDYQCTTAGEKALAEVMVSAYARTLMFSRALNSCLSGDVIEGGAGKIDLYTILGKELDRANRHFTSALQTLIQLKQPSLNVNLKTNNAYVAQAQQFNMNKPESKENKEIINPK